MTPLQSLLAELDQTGAIGLDMSPGDPLARRAAAAIRSLVYGDTAVPARPAGEREAFERWLRDKRGFHVDAPTFRTNGKYVNGQVQNMWLAWQAAVQGQTAAARGRPQVSGNPSFVAGYKMGWKDAMERSK